MSNIVLPPQRFYERRICGRAVPKSVSARALTSQFSKQGTAVGYRKDFILFLQTRNYRHIMKYKDTLRSVEIARSFERKYTQAMRAAELVTKYYAGEDLETLVCSALVSELPLGRLENPHGLGLKNASAIHEKLAKTKKAWAYFGPAKRWLIGYEKAPGFFIDFMERFLSVKKGDKSILLLLLALRLVDYENVQDRPCFESIQENTSGFEMSPPYICGDTFCGVAPLAEKNNFLEIASLLRDQSFRIVSLEAYNHTKSLFESKYAPIEVIEVHLDNLGQIISEAILLSGFKGRFDVHRRVKGIYSQFEKKCSGKEAQADILGIRILVENDEDIWIIKQIIDSLFENPITSKRRPRKFDDVWNAVDAGVIKAEKDEIHKPRSSGYSEYTMLRVDNNGWPVEIKINTYKKDDFNQKDIAAHWIYKFKRGFVINWPSVGKDYDPSFSLPFANEDEIYVFIAEEPFLIREALKSYTTGAIYKCPIFIPTKVPKGTTIGQIRKKLGMERMDIQESACIQGSSLLSFPSFVKLPQFTDDYVVKEGQLIQASK